MKSLRETLFFQHLRNIKNKFRGILNSYYDYSRFINSYTPETKIYLHQKEGIEKWILQDKHRIEKAFSLPSTRYAFGEIVIKRLTSNLIIYRNKYKKNKIYYIGVGAIKAYLEFHNQNNKNTFPGFDSISDKFSEDFENNQCLVSGYIKAKEQPESNLTLEQFSYFTKTRVSCRNYDTKKEINYNLLDEIMKTVMTTPSVCNRQHWKVHFFKSDIKDKILSFQNGNTGFTKNIPMIALICSDISSFYLPEERNQPYTDCGMFSMNLMYTMNAAGLDSCPLNWCLPANKEKQFFKLNLIPNNEIISVVIAFGYRNKNCIKAKSPRINHQDIYSIHE